MILITRPQNQAQRLAETLRRKGLETLIMPLFTVETLPFAGDLQKFPAQKLQSIIITSSNAIEFLHNFSAEIEKNSTLILAIGDRTAKNLRSAGFSNIICAENDAASLLILAEKKLRPETGMIIYLSGEIITLDIAAELSKKGFSAQRIISYRTIARQSFSELAIEKIKDHSIDQVLVYSKNTAEILSKLVRQHNLLEYFSAIELLCLSKEIASRCVGLGFVKVSIINQ